MEFVNIIYSESESSDTEKISVTLREPIKSLAASCHSLEKRQDGRTHHTTIDGCF
jgi:hypothetical protein